MYRAGDLIKINDYNYTPSIILALVIESDLSRFRVKFLNRPRINCKYREEYVGIIDIHNGSFYANYSKLIGNISNPAILDLIYV